MFFFFLLLRLLKDKKISLGEILQDWAAAFLFWWMPFPIAILATFDSILWRNAKARLSLAHTSHLLSPKSFFDSLRGVSYLPECFLLGAWLLIRHQIPLFVDQLGFIGFLFLCWPREQNGENIVWLLLKEVVNRFKRPIAVEQDWNIQKEKYRLLDPNYPLLRKTFSFEGKKTFDFRIEKKEKPHLIFIFLESFRYKEVGQYSPHFDRLAQEGVLFTQFHSNGTRTSQGSIASLYGIPPTYAPSYLRFYLDVPLIGMPHVLKGYESTLIQSGHLSFANTADFFGTHGFTTLFGKTEILKKYPEAKSTSWGVADEAMFAFARERLLEAKTPQFLSLFTITNHHPWKLPESKKGSFFETYAYTDACLGQFMKQLDPILENCVFFILADHGQGLGERDGSFLLNRHLYQENIHVPLLIYAKGRIAEPKVIAEPASQIDLLPTVLDLFGLERPHHSLGRSLQREGSAPFLMVQPSDADPLIAWRDGSQKHIHHLVTEVDEFYDLASDPEEKVNLGKSSDVLNYAQKLHSLYCQKKFCPKTFLGKNPLSLSLKGQLITKVCIDKSTLCLDLTDCLLLNDQDVETIFQQLPYLEELHLESVEDLTGDWKTTPLSLTSLNLLGCPKLNGAKTAKWLASLPLLWCLKLDGTGFCKEDYKVLGNTKTQWWHIEIVNGHSLDEEAREWLFCNQQHVGYFTLDGARISDQGKESRLNHLHPI